MKSLIFNQKCLICGESFKSFSGLHGHLSKREKVSQKEYYQKYYPKYDPYSNSIISFKNLEDYSLKVFNTKQNEFRFFEKNPESDITRSALLSQIKEISTKQRNFPSLMEWVSSKNINFIEMQRIGIFEWFYKQAAGVLDERFDYFSKPYVNPPMGKILVDTREQLPLYSCEKSTINVGDYILAGKDYSAVHIDRKSLPDFISTMVSGLERFEKECVKAKSLNIDLVVVVEKSLKECLSFSPLRWSKQKANGLTAFAGARKLSRKYGIQFVFCNSVDHTKEIVPIILSNPELVKNFDLQFLLEKNIL